MKNRMAETDKFPLPPASPYFVGRLNTYKGLTPANLSLHGIEIEKPTSDHLSYGIEEIQIKAQFVAPPSTSC
jgi:hypothetical protein